MAIKFKLKRGTSTPTTSDLDNGEVGVDTQAKIIYINDSGTVKALGSDLGNVGQTILPSATQTYDLGSSAKKWDRIFAQTLNVAATVNATGGMFSSDIHASQGKFSAEVTCDDVLPNANNSFKIGTSTNKWSEVHATSYYGDGSNLTGVAPTGSITPSASLTFDIGTSSLKYAHIFTDKISNNRIQGYNSQNIYFNNSHNSQDIRIVPGSAGSTQIESNLLPYSDTVYNLGSTNKKWNSNYVRNIYLDQRLFTTNSTTAGEITITGGSNSTTLNFEASSQNTIGSLYFNSQHTFGVLDHNGSYKFKINNNGAVDIYDTLAPNVNNNTKLGTSSKKWEEVHATTYYGDGSNLTGLVGTGANTFTGNQTISKGDPKLILNDTNSGGTSYSIFSDGGQFRIYNESSGGGIRFTVTSNGSVFTSNNLSVSGDISVSGTVDGVDIAALNTTVSNITPGIASLVADSSPQLGGNLDINGKLIEFGDSSGATDDRLKIGSHDDLQLYHDGQDSYINSSQGELIIKHTGNGVIKFERQSSNGIKIDGGANLIPFIDDSAMCGTSSKRWQTVYGVAGNFSGTVTANSFSGDGSNLTGISGGVSSDSQYNTVAGTDAGSSFSGTSAEKNTLFGYQAGKAITTGDANTLIGYQAGEDITTGGGNTIIGEYSGERVTTQYSNVFLGNWAASENIGSSNVSLGSYTMKDSGTGSNCVAVGNSALYYNHNGNHNIGIGSSANYGIWGQPKDYNIGIGTESLRYSTGDYNIGIGREVGKASSSTPMSGDYNVLIGNYSGNSISTGSNNTLLGEYAGATLTTGSNNLILGHEAEPSSATVANEVTLGNSSIAKFRIPGINFELDSGIVSVKNGGTRSEVRWYCESNNAHYAAIKAPAHSAFSGNLTFVLPSGYGSNGQVLQSDGSGGTSWTTPSSGGASVGGANTQVQFNSNGALAGSSNLTFNGTDLAVGGTVSASSSASGTPGLRKITASTAAPSGGSDGDVWIKYT